MSRATVRTKGQILEASIHLFSVRGFGSTSIREIAEAAGVNSALISYHFKNKQGLLESIMVDYYEGLFEILQIHGSNLDCFSRLTETAASVLRFQCECASVTTIILRELSVDSMLIREIMSTYITKLKAYFSSILEIGINKGEFHSNFDLDMQLIHIMSSILFPYFNPQLIREVFYEEPTSEEFRQRYMDFLSKNWFHQLKN
ncbi:MAG TPA: forespore capture DNA-binding protein RefZ [Bacillota bacterium]|nr:forespore capture DNA-binding protein RefZ [Bacillota bacterium]